MSASNVQIHEAGCRADQYLDGRTPGSIYCICRQIRASRSEQIPDRPAHFTWLQGPAERPDPQPISHAEHLQNRVAHWRQERGIA